MTYAGSWRTIYAEHWQHATQPPLPVSLCSTAYAAPTQRAKHQLQGLRFKLQVSCLPLTWISSSTATSKRWLMDVISTVQDMWLAPGSTVRSCPVTKLQGVPSAFRASYTSMASSRRGPQYRPASAAFIACTQSSDQLGDR